MKFSVIVVALNAGEKLNQTLDSVLSQTFSDYEIVLKDGGSSDGSAENRRRDERIRFISQRDKGIYDAMNQAVAHAQGEYILFLNCGDVLYDERVLEKTADCIAREQKKNHEKGKAVRGGMVLYGDTYGSKNDVLIAAPPVIDGFACYRNIPCHQSCFYEARLCKEKPYDLSYRIRADYEHFLWCYYRAGAKMVRMDMTVCAYEGGGYSESRENQKRDRKEHRAITEKYMGRGELLKYRLIMLLSLAPLRRFLAENKAFAGGYHRLKQWIYGKRK